ncbi:MAG: HAMP domain-containing sensor histidine kinase [Ilumatobacteraceae bacterium]
MRPARSLQVRLPLLAVGILAISLAFSAFVMFETLLLTGQRRLDDSLDRETQRLRETIALSIPSALASGEGPAPTDDEFREVITDYLERHARSDDTMTIVRIGDDVLTTADAPTALELLRDSSELDEIAPDATTGLITVGSSQGDIRLSSLPIRTVDDDVSIVVGASLDDVRSNATRSLWRIGAAAGIGLLVAGILLAYSIRRILRPLNDLATAARDAELQELGARVTPRSTDDEVSQLAREFNRMLDRLEVSLAEQRRFMAQVSHELRTPVTIARGHLELLERAPAGDTESVHEIAELVRSELLTMQRLVTDLMTLGQAKDVDFVVPEPVRLREFFDELQLRIVGLGTRKIRFEPVPDEMVHVDPDRLAQAVLNLVNNAALHATGHTEIVLGATTTASSLVVTVTDDGVGIDERLLGSLFEPFVHSEDAHGTTGLGLSVVKAVAEAHHGVVEITSDSTGTAVTITIPHAPFPVSTSDQAQPTVPS